MWWRTIEVDAPCQAAWAVLVDLDCWPAWGPTVAAARLDGEGRALRPDATGAIRPVVGPWVPFRVTAWEECRGWAWRVAGVPATAHRVEPLGPDRCRVGLGVPRWAPAYLAVCEVALHRIRSLATRP